VIGEVHLLSKALVLGDPSAMYQAVRIEHLPPGCYPVHAQVIRYPEGGERIARIEMNFRTDKIEEHQTLGSIGVDSAKVIALDASIFETHWKEVGAERIGMSHPKVAGLIGKQFNLNWRKVNFLQCEFTQPISEDLEERIMAYLQTFPEYAKFPFIQFQIRTMNSYDKIVDGMKEVNWKTIVLDEVYGASLLAFRSGFGDGEYEVKALFGAGELQGFEIEFIGPGQDKILEAFPMLRY
jgi:hypothetical protein